MWDIRETANKWPGIICNPEKEKLIDFYVFYTVMYHQYKYATLASW